MRSRVRHLTQIRRIVQPAHACFCIDPGQIEREKRVSPMNATISAPPTSWQVRLPEPRSQSKTPQSLGFPSHLSGLLQHSFTTGMAKAASPTGNRFS
jgi:hypothetical protein